MSGRIVLAVVIIVVGSVLVAAAATLMAAAARYVARLIRRMRGRSKPSGGERWQR